MPSYTFRCGQGMDFAEQHPIAPPPDRTDCPQCGGRARRMIGVPALGVGRSAAMRSLDRTWAGAELRTW